MVIISYNHEHLIPLILNGTKQTSIHLLNDKWKEIINRFQNGEKIDADIWYKYYTDYAIKIIKLPILKIEKINLNKLTNEDAILDGSKHRTILYGFLKSKYLNSFDSSNFCRLFFDKINKKDIVKPNRTKIEWFKLLYTINPFILRRKNSKFLNCFYECIYCYACTFYNRFCNSKNMFIDGFWENRIRGLRLAKENVFIGSTTDLFNEFMPSKLIEYMIQKINENNINNCNIFYLTKNPNRYYEFLDLFNKKTDYLGCTIETDTYNYQKFKITKAINPEDRILSFKELKYPKKMISIEPIMKFNHIFMEKIIDINPTITFIGLNSNNNCHLVEPNVDEIKEFIEILKKYKFNFHLKHTILKYINQKIESNYNFNNSDKIKLDKWMNKNFN